MKIHPEWVRLPTAWLMTGNSQALRDMKWAGEDRTANLAALIVLMPIAHAVGIAQLSARDSSVTASPISYATIHEATGLSKASISLGLSRLAALKVIERKIVGRDLVCCLVGASEPEGWAKLPARDLYSAHGTRIDALRQFKLRSKVELHALKIYYLVAALRDRVTNTAEVSYEKITERTGVHANDIKPALTLLSIWGLVLVDARPRESYGVIHSYRLVGLHSRLHAGTVGRVQLAKPATSGASMPVETVQ